MLRLIIIIISLSYASHVSAEEKKLLDLDDLAPPDAPALAVLGVSPSEIQRPTSAKAFATSILNDAVRSDGQLASDFAMQFAPYWWSSHPDLTFDDFNGKYNPETKGWTDKPDIPTIFLQSFSISLALSQVKTTLESSTTVPLETDDILGSFGASFDILRGRPSRKQLGIKDRIKAIATRYSVYELQLQVRLEEKFGQDPETSCTPDSNSELCREWEDGRAKIESEVASQIRAEIQNFRNERRVGHRLQFASAMAYRMEDGNTSKRKHARSSAWLTYAYTGEAKDDGASSVQMLALARWNKNELEELGPMEDAYDLGGRLIWEPRNIRVPINVSLEYLRRFSDADVLDGDQRFVAEVNYKVNEETAVFFSAGQNFESNLVPALSGKDFIAIIGIRLAGGGAFTTSLK